MYSMEQGSKPSWHKEPRLYNTLGDLHARFANVNERSESNCKTHFHQLLTQLDGHLRKDDGGIFKMKRIEYTGSSYEKLKVRSSPMEYDVMVVMSDGPKLDKVDFSPVKAGFVKLRPKPNRQADFWKILDQGTGYLSAFRAQSKFRGHVHKILRDEGFAHFGWNEPKEHGPAIQLDIDNGNLAYSIDLVLAYEITSFAGKELFVAKRFRNEGNPDEEYDQTAGEMGWRKSFSIEEKARLLTIDSDQGCRRQCARLFKVLRDSEVVLKPIFSYLIKTTLFYLDDKYESAFWNKSNIAECFLTFMSEMADSLERGTLNHYFIEGLPNMNLLQGYPDSWRLNAANRLRRLVRSETQFYNKVDVIRGFKQTELYDSEDEDVSYEPKETQQSSSGNLGTGAAVVGGVAIGLGLLSLGAYALTKFFEVPDEQKKKEEEKKKEGEK